MEFFYFCAEIHFEKSKKVNVYYFCHAIITRSYRKKEWFTIKTILVLKMVKGTVKWFNERKGFGFITPEEGSDIFVHQSALSGDNEEYKTLNVDDKVEFDIIEGKKGPQASNVVITKKSLYTRGGIRI